MTKAYVVDGLGIGCHEEVAHAYEKAGAEAEIVHIRQLLSGEKKLFDSQILNWSGGFLHGDKLGAGMSAANEMEHAIVYGEKFKDLILEYTEKGNLVYGQCNGFQVLVKTGLLPGINNDYSEQTVTLTGNDCGDYRVAPVLHKIKSSHFAFKDIDDSDLWLMCRHGEGKIQFYSKYGSIKEEQADKNRRDVNNSHILLQYIDPDTRLPTEEFPFNPNGSIDGIAGLQSLDGNIFGHMAHPEVRVYRSREPRFFEWKDQLRRKGVKAKDLDGKKMHDVGLKVFQNIVNYFK